MPKLIKEYENNFKIEWIAVICKGVNQELENIIKHMELPKVIVTEKAKAIAIPNNLQRNLLTLAFVEEQEFEEVIEMVKKFLKTKHFNNILWLYPKATMEDLVRLSNISWTYGNINVLYNVQDRIYTYNPLPNLEVKRLKDFQQFAERKDLVNYHQYPITFPILLNSPRCYRYDKNNTGQFVNTGYMFNIMLIFMKQYNFLFKEYPYDYDEYNRSDLYRGLKNKSFDFVLDNLFRHSLLGGSDIIWNNNLYLIIPYPKPLAKAEYFHYSMKIPLLFGSTILLVTVTIIFLLKQNSSKRDLTRTLLYVFFALNYQFHFSLQKQPKVLKYFVTSIMFLYSLLNTTIFWSSITNLIVSNIFEEKLTTFEEVCKSRYQILLSQIELDYMSKLKLLPPILKNAKIESTSFVLQHTFHLNTSYIYKVLEDRASYILFQQEHLKVPLFYKLDIALYSMPMYFPLRHHLPYIQLFNRYLKYLMESGLMMKLLDNAKWDGIKSGYIQFFNDPIDVVYLFQFEELTAPLRFYFLMNTLALIILMLEIICHKFILK